MTQAPQTNGVVKLTINGLKAKANAQAQSTTPSPVVDHAALEADLHPDYLNGYTLEEIVKARPISDPYQGIILPPYARSTRIDVSSFRTGHVPTPDELAAELRITYEGQIPLAEILDRVVQDTYAKLTELAEVMPSYSDLERKKEIIKFAVAARKQIVKVYAISVWARVADDVQRALNALSFLTRSQQKIILSRNILGSTAGVLIPAKRRNADLLTALDVLTTGTYRRLPTVLKEAFEDYKPISDDEVLSTMASLDDAISRRLRFSELIPVAMSEYKVSDGRVTFTVPKLFEVVLSITGPESSDYWYALDMRFLVSAVAGDETSAEDFPQDPHPWLKNQIISGVNQQLALNSDVELDMGEEFGERPTRALRDSSKVDAPLVRMFNMLQILSLSYALEILHQQAARLLRLGWQEFTNVELDQATRKSFVASYWNRPPPPPPQPRDPNPRLEVPPPLAGRLIFRIDAKPPHVSPKAASRGHVESVLATLEQFAKLGEETQQTKAPSDVEEKLGLYAEWNPDLYALSIPVASEDVQLPLELDLGQLDFPAILRRVTQLHSRAILRSIKNALLSPIHRNMFSYPGTIELAEDADSLRVSLSQSQSIVISMDERTGKIALKDVGAPAASNRSGKLLVFLTYVNRHPSVLPKALKSLKFDMIYSEVQQQALYLSLQCTKQLAIPQSESNQKFGYLRTSIYIRLSPYPDYHLAMLATEEEIRWALVNVKEIINDDYRMKTVEDFGYLDVEKIVGPSTRRQRWLSSLSGEGSANSASEDVQPSDKPDRFSVRTETLRELYAFCCARVSHAKVEQQLKSRGIPWTSVFPNTPDFPQNGSHSTAQDVTTISPVVRSVPSICIRVADLPGSKAGTSLAHPNVRIKVIDWWGEKPCRVVTSMCLRELPPVSKSHSKVEQSSLARSASLSSSVKYDPESGLISFVALDINSCVQEFLEEWERVQRIASIAREVDLTRKKRALRDLKVMSFSLQRIELVYHSNFAVAIQWLAQGGYDMNFSVDGDSTLVANPHRDVAKFLCRRLQTDAARSMTYAVDSFIKVLRDTLPVLVSLQSATREAGGRCTVFVKSALWFRLMTGLRHGVDFRVLEDGKVAISDVSAGVFTSTSRKPSPAVLTVFNAIPGFADALQAAADSCRPLFRASPFPPIIFVDGGVICGPDTLRTFIPKLCHVLLSREQPS